MQLRSPTPELSAAIADHIAAYTADTSSPYHHLAAEFGVLPLYLGWGLDFGLRPDGSVARFGDNESTEIWYGDPEMDVSAVAFGAERHPELKQLFPQRDGSAVDCDSCRGAGFLTREEESVLCGTCHGVGWHN